MNLTSVGTSSCDVPARESAGGIVAPLNAARTAQQRAVPTRFRGSMREDLLGRNLPMSPETFDVIPRFRGFDARMFTSGNPLPGSAASAMLLKTGARLSLWRLPVHRAQNEPFGLGARRMARPNLRDGGDDGRSLAKRTSLRGL